MDNGVVDRRYMYEGAGGLKSFHDWYINWHGYIAAIVCLLGIAANAVNIVVLTRRNMITATNCILTGLAVSDGLTMAAYLAFALRFYVLYGTKSTPERNSLFATRFMLFYAYFSVVVHSVSIWLTVTLAVFRYVSIKYPRRGAELCTVQRAKLSVFLVNVITIVVCIPNFITIQVRQQSIPSTTTALDPGLAPSTAPVTDIPLLSSSVYDSDDYVIWNVEFKEDTEADIYLKNFNFWVQAILVKLVPCSVLTVLSVLLVRTMKAVEERRLTLQRGKTTSHCSSHGRSSCGATTTTTGGGVSVSMRVLMPSTGKTSRVVSVLGDGSGAVDERSQKTNRTTRMLLVVVVLFLVTELPQGIINMLSSVLHPAFVSEVYMPLGDLLDVLALVNNGVNFILYCTMSKQFRDTFISVFLSPCRRLSSVAAIAALRNRFDSAPQPPKSFQRTVIDV